MLVEMFQLWYALGKLKAERVSWRIAEEKGLRLTTICSGLITGPRYLCANPSSTIAYLKGLHISYYLTINSNFKYMKNNSSQQQERGYVQAFKICMNMVC